MKFALATLAAVAFSQECDIMSDERSACELDAERGMLERSLGAMQSCTQPSTGGAMPGNTVSLKYRGRGYMIGVGESGYDDVVNYLIAKDFWNVDDGHEIHFEYMMNGKTVWIEDNDDMAAYMRLPGEFRWSNGLSGSIVNTVMPTSAPTYTEAPTASPTFSPTTIVCQSVFGWGGDGHGTFTLYQNKITLWGGHGNYRQGMSMRNPTEAIYAQLSHGHWNAGAVKIDGGIDIWGNRNNCYNQRPTDKQYIWVQVGNDFACAMTADNTFKCFGANHDNVVNGPPSADVAREVAQYECGAYHCCAVKEDGNMVCWGRNGSGQRNILENGEGAYRAVGTGHNMSIGIRASDNTLRCWGQNHGDPIGQCRRDPLKSMKWKFATCGGYHCCGIRLDIDEDGKPGPYNDRMMCFGYNGHGEVSHLPKENVSGIGNVELRAYAYMSHHHANCALRMNPGEDNDYTPFCWGLNNGNYYPNGGDYSNFYVKQKFPCDIPNNDVYIPAE